MYTYESFELMFFSNSYIFFSGDLDFTIYIYSYFKFNGDFPFIFEKTYKVSKFCILVFFKALLSVTYKGNSIGGKSFLKTFLYVFSKGSLYKYPP